MDLVFLKEGREHVVPLVSRLTIGRAPSNEIVVSSPGVSGRHAMFWIEAGRVWVRDLGSRNGTMLDGLPLVTSAPLDPGAIVEIDEVRISLRGHVQGAASPMLLTEVETGLAHRVPARGLSVGDAFPADLQVPGSLPCTVWSTASGIEVRASHGVMPIATGDTFVLGLTEFRVTVASHDQQVTLAREAPPYLIEVSLTPPRAVLWDRGTQEQVLFTAENRVTLLYLLATHPAEQWVETHDAIVGVWGRLPQDEGRKRLRSLVFRIREASRKAGFAAPWLIRSRGGLRLDAQVVPVA